MAILFRRKWKTFWCRPHLQGKRARTVAETKRENRLTRNRRVAELGQLTSVVCLSGNTVIVLDRLVMWMCVLVHAQGPWLCSSWQAFVQTRFSLCNEEISRFPPSTYMSTHIQKEKSLTDWLSEWVYHHCNHPSDQTFLAAAGVWANAHTSLDGWNKKTTVPS